MRQPWCHLSPLNLAMVASNVFLPERIMTFAKLLLPILQADPCGNHV